jgi:hypothetical protein
VIKVRLFLKAKAATQLVIPARIAGIQTPWMATFIKRKNERLTGD